MPRPLSVTVTASPCLCKVTVMASANSLRYSSTELSTISQTRWCSPLPSTLPMYIDGRRRTASSPSSTVIESAVVYFDAAATALILSPIPAQLKTLLVVLLRQNRASYGIDDVMRTAPLNILV